MLVNKFYKFVDPNCFSLKQSSEDIYFKIAK